MIKIRQKQDKIDSEVGTDSDDRNKRIKSRDVV